MRKLRLQPGYPVCILNAKHRAAPVPLRLVLATFLVALLSLSLVMGCTPELPNKPLDAALAPPEVSGMRQASSYEDIFQNVLDGLEKSFEREAADSEAAAVAKTAYDAAVAAAAATEDQGEDADQEGAEAAAAQAPNQLDAYGPAAREALKASLAQGDGIYAINPKVATVEQGIPSSISPMVRDDNGLLYAVSFEYLRVYSLAGDASEIIASLSLSGFEGGDGEVRSVSLVGTTLAVQLQAEERIGDRASPDYLLAAYAGTQTVVLFFDVSKPADPIYIKTLGISGNSVASEVRDGKLYLVTNQTTTPASTATGWDLQGDEEEDSAAELASIKASLELRRNDPVSFTPAFNDDGNLTALAPEQIYLPSASYYSTATTFACFDIDERRCLSVFAVYDPSFSEQVGTVWGEEDLYLLWRVARFDEQSERQVFSTEVARVALDGTASSGIAEWALLDDTWLYSAFLGERDGVLVGAAEEVAADYRRSWSYVALDRQLTVAGRLGVVDGSTGAQLGSFALLGDKVYAAVAGVEKGLVVLDISDPVNPGLLGSYALDGWPQKLAESDGGTSDGGGSGAFLVGYGSETARELQTMAGVDTGVTPPTRDLLTTLTTVSTDASGKPNFSDSLLIPELSGTADWRSVWVYDLHVFGDLGLAGVPLFNPGEKNPDIMLRTRYILYTVDAQGAAPAAVVDLLTGQNRPVEALGVLNGLSAEDGYSTVVPTYDETSIYLLCAPSNSGSLLPTLLVVLDRSTLQVTKVIAT
jgi:hypothetical protein